jgi:hypothetical protein
MIIESGFIILAILVFSVTATVWLQIHGLPFSLADLTTIQNKPNHSIRRPANAPMLLPSAPPPSAHVFEKSQPQTTIVPAGTIPLDQSTQLDRISQILQTAIGLADKAERLHNAAHEQLDSAHYALQNLLDELSTVMPIASPAKALRDASTAPAQSPRRQTYVTAIAA